MTIHKHLPIYKLAYDLLGVAADLVKNMPRDFKGSFGRKIHDECIELLVLIARTNAARDKVSHIEDMLERVQVAELLFQLSHDKRFISLKQYSQAIQLTSSIGKQANGWKKHSAARPLHAGQGLHA